MEMHCHTPVPKEANRSFHTCVQDVQITRMTTIKVNSSQCYNYNNTRVYLLQNDHWFEKYYRASIITTVILSAA
jgi:hypothetical protein